MKYQAVLFDLDGTLLDTLEDMADALNRTMDSFALPHRSLQEVRSFVGNGARRLIALATGAGGDRLEEILAVYKEDYDRNCLVKTAPYPGIMQLLDQLHAAGCLVGIVSNKPDSTVQSLAEALFEGKADISVGEKSGTHVLISKFGDTDPLVEYTAAQALCIPVIDGVNSIYRLNNVQAITLGGTDISDGKVSMPKTAVTTAKVVTTDYAGYGTLTASRPSAASWLTVTVDGTSIKLTATANSASSAPKRSTTVTVTDGVNTATFTVEQAANT